MNQSNKGESCEIKRRNFLKFLPLPFLALGGVLKAVPPPKEITPPEKTPDNRWYKSGVYHRQDGPAVTVLSPEGYWNSFKDSPPVWGNCRTVGPAVVLR